MNLRIYCIIEEGADRVYTSTGYPLWYKKPAGKQAMVVAVDAHVPDFDAVDRVVTGNFGASWDPK